MMIKSDIQKSETSTFRIKSDLLRQLKADAAQSEHSLNTHVNQILNQYVSWQSLAIKAGFIQYPKQLLSKIFDHLSNEDIVKIAKEFQSSNTAKDLLAFFNITTLDSIVDRLLLWAKSNNFDYVVNNNEKTINFIISHNVSLKFALCTVECWKTMFDDMSIKSEFEINNSTVKRTLWNN